MRCNDFDAHIDEMLSGILYPDANQHMRQCERCTSHFRARAAVQNGLGQLASAALPGPSRKTDQAVMEGYRRLQQRRATDRIAAPPARARMLTFPSRGPVPAKVSRAWMTNAAAAAVLLAVFGSAVHLWHGVPTVNAPSAANAPAVSATQPSAAAASLASFTPNVATNAATNVAANVISSNVVARRLAQRSARLLTQPNAVPSESAALRPASPVPAADETNSNSTPAPSNAAPILHLASSDNIGGAAGSAAQSASSTWPGYSNLMYCDPVVCSGPMQVVHIKVPVGQVTPNSGKSEGNSFVNADVVVGPDGVARAIRVAN